MVLEKVTKVIQRGVQRIRRHKGPREQKQWDPGLGARLNRHTVKVPRGVYEPFLLGRSARENQPQGQTPWGRGWESQEKKP